MKDSTKSSEYVWDYEYYFDYIDPVFVNASTLKYNRYSIVIIFWIILAAFIGFFFLYLYHTRGNFQGKHENAFFPVTV
uniref:Melanocortin 2 receptor accessory protein n=1 Tax=Sinocyclocheilus anshuiensis TaxID=1608454 RepID=A0A671MK47_9TELE